MVSRGAGNWFGSAAISASGRVRKADLVLPGHLGMGRHLFLDTAIADPTSGSALGAQLSSAACSGVAAGSRAQRKSQKYAPLAAGVSSIFIPAVVERYGAQCDQLVGLVSQLCGDGDRDRMRHDDVTFSQSSRSTYMAGMIGLAAVVADAAMVDSVIGLDVRRDDERAVPGARMGKGARGDGVCVGRGAGARAARGGGTRWRLLVDWNLLVCMTWVPH